MGLAWFDDVPPPMDERSLRTGGLPLLPAGVAWPECPACAQPLLFRAQIPLSLTSLVAFDDERLLLVFECHAQGDSGPCDGAAALLVDGDLSPREAPRSSECDVVLHDLGERKLDVLRIVKAVDERHAVGVPILPRTILRSAPESIAQETVRAIEEAGGGAVARPSAPTALGSVHGGRLVPYDDGPRALYRTTLPPLDQLATTPEREAMRGLLGGSLPGYRDYAFTCACRRPTRTAVRLLAHREPDAESGVVLGAAVAQVCLRCRIAILERAAVRPRAHTVLGAGAW